MHYKIYPDVIFLVNLLMDYLVLSVWARLCRITTTYTRLFLASALGAAWSLVTVIFRKIPMVPEIFCTYFGVGFLMAYIAGLRGNGLAKLKGMAMFYAVVVFVGGVLALAGRDSAGTLKITALCVLLYHGTVPLAGLVKRYVVRRSLLYPVELMLNGNSVRTQGLFDTGNSLSDPYNGKPVCVAEKSVIEKLTAHGESREPGIRYIPFCSLGAESGLMRLITVDCMTVEHDGRKEKHGSTEFAIYEGSLSKSGEYHVILNSMCFCQKEE